jgi:hypothetical protein
MTTELRKQENRKRLQVRSRDWSLDIGASLELGAWDLELSAVIAFFD